MTTKLGVVVTTVARNFVAYEIGKDKGFGGGAKLYLCHDKPLVFAKELVDFKNMVATTDEPTYLIDDAWLAEFHELHAIGQGDFLLKLIAGKATVEAGSLDGDIGLFVTNANTHRATTLTGDIALLDMTMAEGLLLVGIVQHEEFSFYLKRHSSLIRRPWRGTPSGMP